MTEAPREVESWLARWADEPFAYLTTIGRRTGRTASRSGSPWKTGACTCFPAAASGPTECATSGRTRGSGSIWAARRAPA